MRNHPIHPIPGCAVAPAVQRMANTSISRENRAEATHEQASPGHAINLPSMDRKKVGLERELAFVWLLARFLVVDVFVLHLVVPLLIARKIFDSGLPESIAGLIAAATVLAYLYGLYRWFKRSSERLEPNARAWYRRNMRRRS